MTAHSTQDQLDPQDLDALLGYLSAPFAAAESLPHVPPAWRTRLVLTLVGAGQPADQDRVHYEGVIDSLVQQWQQSLHYTEVVHRLLDWYAEHSPWFTRAEGGLMCWLAGREPVPLPTLVRARRALARNDPLSPEIRTVVLAQSGPMLNPGETWADTALAELAGLRQPQRARWSALLRHTIDPSARRPTARWTTQGRALLAEVGAQQYQFTVSRWLSHYGTDEQPPDGWNTVVLRGLMWLLASAPDQQGAATVLGALVEAAQRKLPGPGPRDPKTAGAAVAVLAVLDGAAAVAELARLSGTVSHRRTKNEIDTVLAARSAALGLGQEEIAELAVPTFGLSEVGWGTEFIGEHRAELHLGLDSTQLTWRDTEGYPARTPPALVRRDHARWLKTLKATVKDMDAAVAAQRERLDRQFLADRHWAYPDWRARYLDHPLVGVVARRLLWVVDGVACGYTDGTVRDLADRPLAPAAGAEVRLWHPLGRPPAEVAAWRDWLEQRGIVQPFAQAHREVYPLTEAELTTGHSDRFGAHVLRQHQFHTTATGRGWRHTMRTITADPASPASRELPQWGLRAEFEVDGVGSEYGIDTSQSGSYLQLRTGRLRFTALAGGAPVPMAQVPPLVASEVLRDLDLTIAAASVGNDPNWQDGGPDGRYRDYWHRYGFGELSALASARVQLLARILPRLPIADRCTVTDRFLEVRGELGEYRIHLGSAHVLMAPRDSYLCVLPHQVDSRVGQFWLPFLGDRVLSLVLGKALLLAHDKELTDPTITRQLRT